MSVKTAAPGTPGAQLEINVAPPDAAGADPADELEDELVLLEEAPDDEPVADPPPPAPPVQAAPPPAPDPAPAGEIDPEDAADGVVADGEFVRLPRSAFKRIKDRAKRTAAATTTAAADAAAADAGFTSLRGAMTALRTMLDQRRGQQPDDDQDLDLELELDQEMPVATPPKTRNLSDNVRSRFKAIRDRHAGELAAKDAEIERLRTENKAAAERAAAEREAAERRASLAAHGFEDADYAETLLAKRRAESGGAAVDIAAWATELKTSKPYLFKQAAPAPAAAATTAATTTAAPAVAIVPAQSAPLQPTAPVATPVTTAPAAAPQPTMPADGGGAPVRNAMQMTKAELQAARAAKGWGGPGQTRQPR